MSARQKVRKGRPFYQRRCVVFLPISRLCASNTMKSRTTMSVKFSRCIFFFTLANAHRTRSTARPTWNGAYSRWSVLPFRIYCDLISHLTEKLQVVNSPHAQFIRELQANYLKEEGGLATSALDWDRARGSDFRCLAQAIYTIDKYSAAFKTAPTILQLEKWLSDDSPVSALFRKKITDTFDILVLLVHEKSTKAAFKKPAKVSPVEFILIVVLIAVWKDKMSLAELSESVGKMREDVRMYHSDIRMNTKVTKTMLDFMRGLKASKTAPDQTAAAVTKSKPPPSSAPAPREKRKRTTDKMDVDEEPADNDSELSEPSEEEQLAKKKVKRSPPNINATASSTTSIVKSASGLPNLHPVITGSTPASLGTTPGGDRPQPSQSRPQLPTPSQPAVVTMSPVQQPPTQPRMDRLAGLRAARVAAGFVPPLSQAPPSAPARSVSGNGIGNGKGSLSRDNRL